MMQIVLIIFNIQMAIIMNCNNKNLYIPKKPIFNIIAASNILISVETSTCTSGSQL